MKKLFLLLIGVPFLLASCNHKTQDNKATSSEDTSKTKDEKTVDNKKVKMILDLDTGIDDAMALAYAVSNPNIDLIGVVTSFGNVSQATSASNTLALLDLLGANNVPVYAGADRPTGGTSVYEADANLKFVHGQNGVGNVTIPQSNRTVEKQNGVDFMIQSAQKYGKDLYIVAVGPDTNLAEVLKKDPQFGEQVGKIVIMGGALIVEGNINKYAEANIYNDPIAANELFTSPTEFTMVGLEVTQRPNLTKTDTQKWRELGTASGKAYADMIDYYIDVYAKNIPGLGGCALHDPLAVAASVHPEYLTTMKLPMKVGTAGEEKGRTVAVAEKLNDPKAANVAVAVDLDIENFMADFKQTLTNVFEKN